MKGLTPELSNHLLSGTTTLSWCWRITRADGDVFGFTDHDLDELVDAPLNGETLVDLYAATAEALAIWEPRISVEQVTAAQTAPGKVTLTMSGIYTPTGEPVTVDGIEVSNCRVVGPATAKTQRRQCGRRGCWFRRGAM